MRDLFIPEIVEFLFFMFVVMWWAIYTGMKEDKNG
jgi:hypothetical protein